MKLEKREITLNEYDSLSDMLASCERLLSLYKTSAVFLDRKETRTFLKESIGKTLDEIYFLKDLLNGVQAEQV
jgi:hypothetical protein